MEYKENEWYIHQDSDNERGLAEDIQVPPSLLPTVLHRLGLTPEQAQSEMSADELVEKLKSEDWVIRAAAVRALGKLENNAPIELLVSALDDEDGTVRAAAVHVLGNMRRRVPLHRLVEALHDPDWHVRETAVLALGKRERRIPKEVLMTALNDTDETVRVAARLALQWNSAEERTSVAYGRLWEQKTMQDDKNEIAPSTENRTAYDTMPEVAWNGTREYNGYARSSESFHGVREQAQEYASPEHAPYEYGNAMSSRLEKVTSLPPRRSQKWWWVAIAATAVVFFLLGAGTFQFVMPVTVTHPVSVRVGALPGPAGGITVGNPQNAAIVVKEVSGALNLTPDQIAMQLKQGKSLTDIAAAQGVSATKLHDVELQAFQDMTNAALKAGDIDQNQANKLMDMFKRDPGALDKMTTSMFFVDFSGQNVQFNGQN